MTSAPSLPGVEFKAAWRAEYDSVLSPEAVAFAVDLHRRFNQRRQELLAARAKRADAIQAGQYPDFLPETAHVRESDWTIAPLPADLLDRRCEITGPVDRKMVINALNSGAKVFMADFEDATTPTWDNQIQGQINLRDANLRQIDFADPNSGKEYKLNDQIAVLKVRPRGWHLEEKHVLVDGEPMSGSIWDFALYLFHNHATLKQRGTGPYFYLPKMESHLEARLWNDIFVAAQTSLGMAQGTIKATVLIETIVAAFEMDEILYELREHSAGLNCGRWDYIFSYIKKFKSDSGRVLPNRSAVTMTVPFMRSYSLLAIKQCHQREAPAIGGMAAFIPIKGDEEANEQALAKVRADKKREAEDGHDGSWVAHPALVPICLDEFTKVMGDKTNQIDRKRDDITVTAADLIAVPDGPKDMAGLRNNISVGIGYLEAWLRGIGCVPLFNMMEDAATAEISRAQVWQWLHYGVTLDDGTTVTPDLFEHVVDEELLAWRDRVGDEAYTKGRFEEAAGLFKRLSESDEFAEFLTLPAYNQLVEEGV